jgi:CheY-like chemotaxis protein
VESAEQAIDYLSRQRPDVIFMDHLMPGMDGFQAVQAIKNNPRTATIPIMMYTSQEGELYLSQARALGAVGVLPKQIKHADVSKALEQLHLIGGLAAAGAPAGTSGARASGAASSRAAANDGSHGTAADIPVHELPEPAEETDGARSERRGERRPNLPALPPNLRAILDAMFAHHNGEMRRFVVDHMENSADRIIGDMRLLLQDQPPQAGYAPAAVRPANWGSWLAIVALVIAGLFALEWARAHSENEQLATTLAAAQQQLQASQDNLTALQTADAQVVASETSPNGESGGVAGRDQNSAVEGVPFGELPLAGARTEQVLSLLGRLKSQGFQGTLQVRSFPGRYCMVTNPAGQLVQAPDTTPYSKCDQIGNPREDNGSTSDRESIAFANMVSAAKQSDKGIDVQISAGTTDEVLTPYPAIGDSLLAGEWNRAANANNRVELRWQASR